MDGQARLGGVIAALLLPRDGAGRPLWGDFERNAAFAVRAGVTGLCVNGATGEFAGATRDERRETVARARRIAGGEGIVLSGIGGTRWTEILALARDAEEAGASVLLVPPPHFFRYGPGDLAEFYTRIAAEVRVPALIYNLPAFTGALDENLALRLIDSGRMAGVKDSSGELGLLERLTASKQGAALRFVGNDGVLAEALLGGLCDGVVSGVAGVLPELTLSLWQSRGALFDCIRKRLAALIELLDAFPTPWGLKLIAELRGLGPASFALPLSPEREAQAEAFRRAWPEWWFDAEPDLTEALCRPVHLRAA